MIDEIREVRNPREPLITISISNSNNGKEENLSYYVYKDPSSGEKRIEKNIPPKKREMLTGFESREEQFRKGRILKEDLMGRMEDVNIRRFRGLSKIGEQEVHVLLQILNALSQ